MYKNLSKLQKMFGEIFFVTLTILIIAATFSSKRELERDYQIENGLGLNEDLYDPLAPYAIGFFLWAVYAIIWYLRICFQNVDAPENDKKSYKNTVNLGCLPTLLLIIIVVVLCNIFK